MIRPSRLKGSMRLDDWVLCRVRQKGNMSKNTCEGQDSPSTELVSHLPTIESQPTYTNHNTGMFTDPLFKDCHQVIASILMYQDLPPIKTVSSVSFQGSNEGNSCSSLYEDISDKMNSPITVSSFDSFLNPSKRKKSIEGNRCANSPSKKQLTNNNKNEDPCGNTLGNNDMFYNQNQSQYNFFNPNPSNSIINLQDLTDELAFTEGYIQ
ncbi:hypothetical protein L1049_013539 [Liquidambar formosana]|uniref:Uncharacterized protein n=1 Tax=Liquidambar formosana TaxID=63359 RepID=A0AAP0RP10_LIQFO